MTGVGGSVEIVEVSPRDGLQNERAVLATERKLALVERVVAAGARRVEVTSFVRPDRVPQMADAEKLMAALPHRDDVAFSGLVLNRRGAARAVDAGVDELNFVVPCTDTFGANNQGMTTGEAMDHLRQVAGVAAAAGVPLSVTLAVAFGCPYEGDVSRTRFEQVARLVLEIGPAELVLADTIGAGVPGQVTERFGVAAALGPARLRGHFHDTRRTGLANAWAAVGAGAFALDASVGGLGGCPFAPGSAGNVATEDLAWMLARSGVATTIDVERAASVGHEVSGWLGVAPRSGVGRAGPFPVFEGGPS